MSAQNMRKTSAVGDLELLTGKIVRGDITPLVYSLVKDSGYLDLFVKDYIDYMSDEEKSNVFKQDPNTDTIENVNRRLSFEEWLANEGELVTIQRNI